MLENFRSTTKENSGEQRIEIKIFTDIVVGVMMIKSPQEKYYKYKEKQYMSQFIRF